VTGRISKIGDAAVRTALYEAAHIVLTKPVKGCSQLKSWAMRIARSNPYATSASFILHAAAYWLMLTMRDATPSAHTLAEAEFATLRLRCSRLGARVIETAARVRLPFAAACPDAAIIRQLATTIVPPFPDTRGRRRPVEPPTKPSASCLQVRSSRGEKDDTRARASC
jgi:hypothetical protein